MKTLTFLIAVTVAFATSGLAQDEARLDRLARLDQSYKAELERVTKPVETKYKVALEQLLKEFTKSGALEAAVAVKEKLAALENSESNDSLTSEFPQGLFDVPLRWFEDGRWITLHKDGTVTTSWGGDNHWRKTAPDKVKFSFAATLENRGPGEIFGVADDGRTSKLRKATQAEVSTATKAE